MTSPVFLLNLVVSKKPIEILDWFVKATHRLLVRWLVDRQADVLRLEAWNKPSPDTAEFEAVSRKTSFRKGEDCRGVLGQAVSLHGFPML